MEVRFNLRARRTSLRSSKLTKRLHALAQAQCRLIAPDRTTGGLRRTKPVRHCSRAVLSIPLQSMQVPVTSTRHDRARHGMDSAIAWCTGVSACLENSDMSLANHSPVQQYLAAIHARLLSLEAGAVASYIPELALADPGQFGICIATVDGQVYEIGDSRQEFTIQSISKAISYGLALEDNGVEAMLRKVDVEPSGEAFNSISLHPDTGRPRNPMINAGAIATCGMLKGTDCAHRLQRLLQTLERYVGHPLIVDANVYHSEKATGHRNRALAHLMYGFGILEAAPEEVLDLYFQQCAIMVSCRDLALIGACFANAGVNPITRTVALQRSYVPKVLSVMSSCGMYDASGAWVYNIGMPAKSGVGGGIVAVLPGQIGIGVYSPALDERGNSVRGLAVCEAISQDFNLHLFQSIRTTSTAVIRASYAANQIGSRRVRHPADEALLKAHGEVIRVYQLQGELVFGSTESLLNQIAAGISTTVFFVVDLKQVSHISHAAAKLFADFIGLLQATAKVLLFTETHDKPAFRNLLADQRGGGLNSSIFGFQDSDRAVEWCEDQLLEKFGSVGRAAAPGWVVELVDHGLAVGMPDEQFGRLLRIARRVTFPAGGVVVSAGQEAESMFLIVAGEVEVSLRLNGDLEKRLTTLGPGMSFGEMAMVNRERRTADIRAIVDTVCYEVAFDDLDDGLRSRLLINLAQQLSHKLLRVEREMQLLGG